MSAPSRLERESFEQGEKVFQMSARSRLERESFEHSGTKDR